MGGGYGAGCLGGDNSEFGFGLYGVLHFDL